MAAADVDVGYLSAHLGVPDEIISETISQPTAELVKAVLAAVAAKAHEYEVTEAEKLRLGIELEGAIRGSEARCEQFKETSDKALKELEETREKLRNEGARTSQSWLIGCDRLSH